MAYICAKCIAAHGLEEEAAGFSCSGFCEVCQPIFFEGIRPGWHSQHTTWVPAIVRSLDDPDAIPRQLRERVLAAGAP